MGRLDLHLRDSPNGPQRRAPAAAAAAVGVLMLAARHLSPHKGKTPSRPRPERRSSMDSVVSHAVSETQTEMTTAEHILRAPGA
jgi:hypothetical protein